jgi:flagellar motility protein MotE (MotC chaperone)
MVRRSCVLLFGCSLLLIMPAGVRAQSQKGEIINVNYKYRIAFTDLSEGDVRLGDAVSVALGDGRNIELNVVEAYPVMAKLAAPADTDKAVSDDDFAKISVGAEVRPVPRAVKTAAAVVETALSLPAAVAAPKSVPIPDPVPVVPAGAAAPAVTSAPVPASSGKMASAPADSTVERLTANTVSLSEHIAELLTEKKNREAVLKAREAEIAAVNKKNDGLLSDNAALNSRVSALQRDISRLQALNSDGQKQIADLGLKLSEVKKKLGRLAEIVNKNMKAYE